VNGATRLQPSTMLIGQAAGAISALAVKNHMPPRALNPIAVQAALLGAGSNLIQRWYSDIHWGTKLWQATQLLSLYGVMDEPGAYVKDQTQSMSGTNAWRPDSPLETETLDTAIKHLAKLAGKPVPEATLETIGNAIKAIDPKWQGNLPFPVTRGQFAIAAAEVLKQTGRPVLMSDADAPPMPRATSPVEMTPAEKKKAAKEAKKKKKLEAQAAGTVN
jgi:hypothetical protein